MKKQIKLVVLFFLHALAYSHTLFSQDSNTQCTVYIVHYRHLTDDIYGTGLDPHNDKYPVQISLPNNKKVWLVGEFAAKHNYSYLQLILDSSIVLQFKTIENPRTTNYSTSRIRHWSTFLSVDTSIQIKRNSGNLYFRTVRYKKKNKLFFELKPLDSTNKKDAPFLNEIKKHKPIAVYNQITGEFTLIRNWESIQ